MIQVQISDDALEDLATGAWFYQIQEAGLGEYFSTSKSKLAIIPAAA